MSVCSFIEKLCEAFSQWSSVHRAHADAAASSDSDSSSSTSTTSDEVEDVSAVRRQSMTPSSKPSGKTPGAPRRGLTTLLDEVGTDDSRYPINYAATTARKRPRTPRTSSPRSTLGSDDSSLRDRSPSDSSRSVTQEKNRAKRRRTGSGIPKSKKYGKGKPKKPMQSDESSDDPDMRAGIFHYCLCFYSFIHTSLSSLHLPILNTLIQT